MGALPMPKQVSSSPVLPSILVVVGSTAPLPDLAWYERGASYPPTVGRKSHRTPLDGLFYML